MNEPRVALVNMPFAILINPSLGLGLLKAALARDGIGARVYNMNLRAAAIVGVESYARVNDSSPADLLGEWVFSEAVFGPGTPDEEREYFRIALGVPEIPPIFAERKRLLLAFLDACFEEEDWGRYAIVGFTSMFQQHTASLALAKRIKEKHPGVFIVFGGANCEGPMGAATFRAFPFVDAVCSGEADDTFPKLARRVLANEPIGDLPGVLHRQPLAGNGHRALPRADRPTPPAPPVHDMDALPVPDFDEYFEETDALRSLGVEPRLTFETSRGCWWGAKQHCTFCGLNGGSMAFRHKSARRALDEIDSLLARYGHRTRHLSAADNIIPLDYFKDFLPELSRRKLALDLFYETKSNLKKEQIALYAAAGCREIQPGVESLVTRILGLMRKGVTRLQNIQALKWCRQFGVVPHWNYIVGFPGERPDDYEGQDDLARGIAHLTPPEGCGPVRFDRFSPYFNEPAAFGIRDLRPNPSYAHVYRGLSEGERRDLAYYFVGEYDGLDAVKDYTAPLKSALDDWRDNADRYALFALPAESETRLQLFDFRPGKKPSVLSLEGAALAVHEACDGVTSRATLEKKLTARGWSAPAIDEALAFLIERRLVLAEGDTYLTVTIPLGSGYAPAPAIRGRMRELF
jgi:ribosomal peptide maturation radical SAM protein 1